MAWNDPDDKNRDPWGGRRGNEGPPDLDEVVRKMQEKLGGLFGGGGRSKTRSPIGGSPMLWWVVIAGLLLLLVIECFYRIEPAEQGVVLRFGRHVATLSPGLHLRFPRPVEEVIKVNVEQFRPFTVKSSMLTKDENIVDVEIAVQYRIKNVENYLFENSDPDISVHRAAESAIRDVIGGSTLDFVITEGRAENSAKVRALIQQILDEKYLAGIDVTSVNMQPAKPPEEVKAAFDDAIKAREDEQRRINEAEAYRNEVVEKAQGTAHRIRLEAEGYREEVIARSEGEANRFEQILAAYEKAPEVTRQRLYLEAIEEVFSHTNKIMIDAKGGNSLMYLPLDKLMEQSQRDRNRPSGRDFSSETSQFAVPPDESTRDSGDGRLRGVR